MLYTINLKEYNFNNCKFIVLKNSLDIDFNFNNKIIQPNQQIFKTYSDEILTLETEFNIDIKTLGYIILINIYKTTIITKDFFLNCGSIKNIYRNIKSM